MEERLQKFMARCGVASRRKCEELIADGLVEVNGETVREPGVKIDPKRDRVRVDGKPVRAATAAYYAHYKVKGVTTTVSDDLGRKTIMDCLPDIPERVFPVGRLDKDSEGLILFTNDGEMANYITHPAHGIGKTYRVVAEGRVPKETLDELAEKGMRLGPVLVRPTRVQLVRYDNENTVVLISVAEGINREVRRIFAALGHEVKKLLRTQIGPVELEGMKRGATRPLTQGEIARLRKGMAGMDPEAEAREHPKGSAASRKPTGPRGRGKATMQRGKAASQRGKAAIQRGKAAIQRGKAPRQGKPDPAKATPRRDKVTVDDWKKNTGPRRPAPKPAAAAPKPRAAAPKSRAAAFAPRAAAQKPRAAVSKPRAAAQKPRAAAPKPRGAAHPLKGKR